MYKLIVLLYLFHRKSFFFFSIERVQIAGKQRTARNLINVCVPLPFTCYYLWVFWMHVHHCWEAALVGTWCGLVQANISFRHAKGFVIDCSRSFFACKVLFLIRNIQISASRLFGTWTRCVTTALWQLPMKMTLWTCLSMRVCAVGAVTAFYLNEHIPSWNSGFCPRAEVRRFYTVPVTATFWNHRIEVNWLLWLTIFCLKCVQATRCLVYRALQ